MFRQERASQKSLGKTKTRLPVYYTAEKANHVSSSSSRRSDMKGGRTPSAPATSAAARQNKQHAHHQKAHVKNVAFAIPESFAAVKGVDPNAAVKGVDPNAAIKSVDSKNKKRRIPPPHPTRKKTTQLIPTGATLVVPGFSSSLSTSPLKKSLPTTQAPPPDDDHHTLASVSLESSNLVKVEVPIASSILTANETQTDLYLVGKKLPTKFEFPASNGTELLLWTEPGSQVESSSVQSASSCKSLGDERHSQVCSSSAVGSDGDHQKQLPGDGGLSLLSTSKRKFTMAIEFCLLLALGGILAIGMIPYFESAMRSYLANTCSCLDHHSTQNLLLDGSFSEQQQQQQGGGGLRGGGGGLFHWSKCPLLANLSLGFPSKNNK